MKKFIVSLIILWVGLFVSVIVYAVEPEPDKFKMDTSENLTAWAWENYKNDDYERAIEWAKLCTYYWGPRAIAQSEDLTVYPRGSISEVYANYWALNDVGTGWLIIGESYRHLEDNYKAEIAYKMLIDENKSRGEFYFAQSASEPGKGTQFLWKPANVAYARLIGYKPEILDNAGLIKAAWRQLKEDRNKARKFAELGINMFSEFLPAEWAVNDVATCYFIIGEAWRMDNSPKDANEFYGQIVNNEVLKGAQCLDLGPDGTVDTSDDFYWDVVQAAQDRMALTPNDVPTMPDIYPMPVK